MPKTIIDVGIWHYIAANHLKLLQQKIQIWKQSYL